MIIAPAEHVLGREISLWVKLAPCKHEDRVWIPGHMHICNLHVPFCLYNGRWGQKKREGVAGWCGVGCMEPKVVLCLPQALCDTCVYHTCHTDMHENTQKD